MEKHKVKVLDTFEVTHDVKGFRVEKPEGYLFLSGQATEVAINRNDWQEERRPFTFTNLPEEDVLEFMIKIYPSHKGVTNELKNVKINDELIIHDVFGDITYKGKGVFIAGGAGVTPFISIFRQLKMANDIGGNMLILANKSKKDIIMEEELQRSLRSAFINVLEEEEIDGYEHGRITKELLKKHINTFDMKFYVCGPPAMMDSVLEQFSHLEIPDNSIIMEG